MFAFCDCFNEITIKEAMKYFCEEVIEFIEDPSMDEFSDICFTLGRLIGSVIGRKYVRVFGDQRTIDKMRERMMAYGCIKSRRNLGDGGCPSK